MLLVFVCLLSRHDQNKTYGFNQSKPFSSCTLVVRRRDGLPIALTSLSDRFVNHQPTPRNGREVVALYLMSWSGGGAGHELAAAPLTSKVERTKLTPSIHLKSTIRRDKERLSSSLRNRQFPPPGLAH